MARSRSHGLLKDDVLRYKKYLDETNGERSPDTAPTLIPVLDGENVVLKSFEEILQNNKQLSEAQDEFSKSISTLDIEHWYIHRGKSFFNGTVVQVAGNGTFDWVVEVGDCPIHLIFRIGATESGISFVTYEDVEANADGTLQGLINHNRLSSNETEVKMRLRPTGVNIANATVIRQDRIGRAGAAPVRQGGSAERENEVIFKPNTKYLLRVTNLSNNTNYVRLFHAWYENGECQQ